ncbi:aldehyde dehydrogenase family protein [Pseudomonas chlororaphis]|uniref:aldehyde dehydrogenase family protein n=1 Tax=Pseudomonas chlororaphis TaxID=587753 RepID=UPI0006A5D3DA|nr:aldehyde dehydrogenase family protein [Pseudomonas chlororaphis]AZD02571.1 Aldehyde dehydrogenase [Pseudomonas chlororaphis subsp. chlororaphis]MBM0280617.1 aldehyde dehydrogenase [Pseudomonas chlororaphis]MDO1504743.1 aldehyde dehydrogenase [Pseudomonas chlororaphis]ORM44503.1 aldehyde dehydrogenase [Pseudomonas chlororaphis subsp. chlororaphis]TWR95872.1 aldehyde dehydrogenase [Pseudomonas chlororaphis subsp. chlororaphis]
MDSFDPRLVAVRSAHFIAGQYRDAAPGLEVSRPSDGQAYGQLPIADAGLVDEAVNNAWQAFARSDWASRPPRERARVMRRWADLVEADAAILAPLEAVGSTRPHQDVIGWDIPYVAEGIRFFAELADKYGGSLAATQTDRLGMQIAEPYGVIAAIAPWNFPLSMASWKVAPALAAGNAVVLKPSELTPFSSLRFAELALQAGVPAGIFNVVQGDGRVTGDALCRHPRVAKVTFTGSTATGSSIMSTCALVGPKPVTLELGGKSPQLVFADVPDLAKTARTVAMAITGNAGQVCVSGSRLLIERSIMQPFVEHLRAYFEQLRPGPTWSSASTLSPIISRQQANRIDGIVQRSRQAGAEVLCGGGLFDGLGGAYYQPTLLTGLDNRNPAVCEEIFGPVLTVQAFDDEAEALALAEHATYGLAAGVHTADINRALRLVRRLEAGTVWVNRYGRSNDYILPTGGYKRSGIGKDLGREAFEANLRFKSVLIDIAG